MSRRCQEFTVHVFRPNGQLLTRITQICSRYAVAINRAKLAIYQQGRLAHFYTYVAIQK